MVEMGTTPGLPALPQPAERLLQEYLRSKSLGASRNIRQINNLLCSIAQEWPTASTSELTDALILSPNRIKNISSAIFTVHHVIILAWIFYSQWPAHAANLD